MRLAISCRKVLASCSATAGRAGFWTWTCRPGALWCRTRRLPPLGPRTGSAMSPAVVTCGPGCGRRMRCGLWPVLVSPHDGNPKVPWVVGEVSPEPVASIDSLHAGEVLAAFWTEWVEDGSDLRELEPFGHGWPGLAQATDGGQQPDEFADQFVRDHEDGTSRIMLVPAARSADVITSAGWQGPLNFSNDMAPLSSVLRSWEDRFGARLVELGLDTLALTVAAPPVTTEHAEHVAAEQFAFCPDNIVQGQAPTIREYAARMVQGKTIWSFWWD